MKKNVMYLVPAFAWLCLLLASCTEEISDPLTDAEIKSMFSPKTDGSSVFTHTNGDTTGNGTTPDNGGIPDIPVIIDVPVIPDIPDVPVIPDIPDVPENPDDLMESTRIAFVSDRDGQEEIYVMKIDGSQQYRVTYVGGYGPAWYPAGLISFTAEFAGDEDIWLIAPDGNASSLIDLTQNPFSYDWSPAWSPTGDLAYVSGPSGASEIYAVSFDGATIITITNNGAYNDRPTWSPDRSWVAFESDMTGDTEIYKSNGTNQVSLTDNFWEDYEPAWSPDGTKIAFTSDRDGNLEIYVMNADGSNQRRLTSNFAEDSWPTWSPDGEKIAFMSDRDGDYEIYVMNADGTNQVNITNNISDDMEPAWSIHSFFDLE